MSEGSVCGVPSPEEDSQSTKILRAPTSSSFQREATRKKPWRRSGRTGCSPLRGRGEGSQFAASTSGSPAARGVPNRIFSRGEAAMTKNRHIISRRKHPIVGSARTQSVKSKSAQGSRRRIRSPAQAVCGRRSLTPLRSRYAHSQGAIVRVQCRSLLTAPSRENARGVTRIYPVLARKVPREGRRSIGRHRQGYDLGVSEIFCGCDRSSGSRCVPIDGEAP